MEQYTNVIKLNDYVYLEQYIYVFDTDYSGEYVANEKTLLFQIYCPLWYNILVYPKDSGARLLEF